MVEKRQTPNGHQIEETIRKSDEIRNKSGVILFFLYSIVLGDQGTLFNRNS